MELEFFTWSMLATSAGALAMTVAITQFTKGISFIAKIPTRIWSYVIALVVLYPALYFTGQLDTQSAILTLFNGVLISLAANGGYEAVLSMATGGEGKEETK